ncbi:metal-dependent hydrolase [Chloroflexota bacterium]
MLLFAHAGIALGAASVFVGVWQSFQDHQLFKKSWFLALSEYMDIRILMIGSMLPDIIDKPIGMILLKDTISYGRIYAHTLLFLLPVTVLGYFLEKRYHHRWLLTLAVGTLIHLVLDEIWQSPKVLLWPFLGTLFPRIETDQWFVSLFEAIFAHPFLYITETIGLAVLVLFIVTLVRNRKFTSFIKNGTTGSQ